MRLILLALLGLLLCVSPVIGQEPEINVAALVNGTVISQAEYRSEVARLLRLRKKSAEELSESARAMLGKEALETLIGRELLYQESRKSGAQVAEADVAAEIALLRSRFPDDSQFDESLGKLNLTREGLATQIRRGIAIQALIEARFSRGVKLSEHELRSHYDLHKNEYGQQHPRVVPPFEDVRELVERQLRQERLMGEVTPFVKRLRESARVEIRLTGE